METNKLRITNLKDYLATIVATIVKVKPLPINVDFLNNNANNYSINRIPTESKVEMWVNGTEIKRDVYSFRNRKAYSQEVINNLENIGFFEIFEKIIKSNNRKGILPNIEGIQSIECLNTGTMQNAETKTAVFDIQIEIKYIEGGFENESN